MCLLYVTNVLNIMKNIFNRKWKYQNCCLLSCYLLSGHKLLLFARCLLSCFFLSDYRYTQHVISMKDMQNDIFFHNVNV